MNVGQVLNVPQLVVALEMVQRWREETEAQVHRQIQEIEEEEERLRTGIAELQRQLKAVSALRGEMEVRLSELDEDQLARTREAVLSGIEAEGPLIEERARQWDNAARARSALFQTMLRDPENARLVEEYRQFSEQVEPILDTIPAHYRRAILAAHEEVRTRLKPIFDAAAAPPEPLELEPAGFTIIATLDPAEGPPDALVLIVPVPYDTYARWSERGDDLHALIAFRIVGAVGGMLASVGASDALLRVAPYKERLALQVWLGDSTVEGSLREALENEISRLGSHASELAVTRLEPHLVWLTPEAILSEDDEDEDTANREAFDA